MYLLTLKFSQTHFTKIKTLRRNGTLQIVELVEHKDSNHLIIFPKHIGNNPPCILIRIFISYLVHILHFADQQLIIHLNQQEILQKNSVGYTSV